MKKVLLIMLLCVFSLVGCNKEKKEENKLPTTEEGKVVEVNNTTTTVPKFTVGTLGLYDGGFNNESLKDAKVYEITATMNDGYSEETHTYKGYRLTEVLKLLEINSYNEITFSSTGTLNVKFYNNEINDDIYLFFERDGIYLEKAPLNLLVPNEPARYSIQNITTLKIA